MRPVLVVAWAAAQVRGRAVHGGEERDRERAFTHLLLDSFVTYLQVFVVVMGLDSQAN